MAKTIQYREQRITQSHKHHILPDFSDQHGQRYRENSKILRHILIYIELISWISTTEAPLRKSGVKHGQLYIGKIAATKIKLIPQKKSI